MSDALVLGVDASFTGTACVWMRVSDAAVVHRASIVTGPKDYPHLVARADAHRRRFGKMLADRPVSAAAIEGYGFSSKSLSMSVTLGSFYRLTMFRAGVGYLDVAPSALKKFATGAGGDDKSAVRMVVLERWKYRSASDDDADAYVCAQVARMHVRALAGDLSGISAYDRKLLAALVLNRPLPTPPVTKGEPIR